MEINKGHGTSKFFEKKKKKKKTHLHDVKIIKMAV